MMNEYGLSQHNDEISHPASDILDLILTNNSDSVSHVYYTPGMSDHNAVILPQYKQKPKRSIFMHDKAYWHDIHT